jgi:hypothetical protein
LINQQQGKQSGLKQFADTGATAKIYRIATQKPEGEQAQ